MGYQHPLDRPGENAIKRGTRRAAIDETRAPFPRSAWIRRDNAVEPSEQSAPTFEPGRAADFRSGRETRRAAGAAEEHHLGHNETVEHQDLIDIRRPFRFR